MKKSLGFLLLSLGISFATILVLKPSLLEKDLEAEVVGKIWKKDIEKLVLAGQLPASWHQIKEIKIRAHSPKAAKWLRSIQPPINLNHKGRYLLEVTVDHNEEKDSLAVITQYNLVDINSQNTLWEFGRTYVIPNKKWISRGQKVLSFLSSIKKEKNTLSSQTPEETTTENEQNPSHDKKE